MPSDYLHEDRTTTAKGAITWSLPLMGGPEKKYRPQADKFLFHVAANA